MEQSEVNEQSKDQRPSGSTGLLLDDDLLLRAVLLELCVDLQPVLGHNTKRTHALPVPKHVLTTLRFLAVRPAIGANPVHPEPNHASCVGRNHPHARYIKKNATCRESGISKCNRSY